VKGGREVGLGKGDARVGMMWGGGGGEGEWGFGRWGVGKESCSKKVWEEAVGVIRTERRLVTDGGEKKEKRDGVEGGRKAHKKKGRQVGGESGRGEEWGETRFVVGVVVV